MICDEGDPTACGQLRPQRVGVLVGECVLPDILVSNGSGSKAPIHDRGHVRRKQRDRRMPASAPPLRRQPDPKTGLHCAVFSNNDGGLRQYCLALSLDLEEAALAATPPDHGPPCRFIETFGEQAGYTQPPRPGGEHSVLERGRLGGKDHPHSTRRSKRVTLDVVHV